MAGTYKFDVDCVRGLLIIRFAGFFRPSDLVNYEADKQRALQRLGCAPNAHATLCDFTDCGPQSPEVLELLVRSLADPASASRQLAVVVSAALVRMQVNRVVTREGTACFSSLAEAKHWLVASSAVPLPVAGDC